MKDFLLNCDCSSIEHSIVFKVDSLKGYPSSILVYVQLNNWLKWYQRLWVLIKWLFKVQPSPGQFWDGTLLDLDKTLQLRDYLNKFLEREYKINNFKCIQKPDEEEFFCKYDGSVHSCYCPLNNT